jgi:hypothetical protein
VINPKSITHHSVIVLPSVRLPHCRRIGLQLHPHHWGKQWQYNRRGRGGFSFVPRHALLRALQVQPDLTVVISK